MSIKNDKERYYTLPVDICGVLRALQTAACSVQVQFDQRSGSFTSCVLDVDSNEHCLLLDELKPPEGHRLLDTGAPFSIRASLDDHRVYASGLQCSRTLNYQSGVLYQVPFPDKILFLQRRDAFRLTLPANLNATAVLSSPTRSGSVSAQVLDVSLTGVRLGFADGILPPLTLEERVDLQITVAELNERICLPAELRNQYPDKESGQTICGFRFVTVNRITQNMLNRFIAQLQQQSPPGLPGLKRL
jgi:flagellar brake protein